MAAIYKKEVRSYFTSMIGCVFVAFALVIIGLYFFANNLYGGYPYFGYSLSATIVVFLILIPILTMKSVADDRRQKTDQMLLTAPVSTWKIIASKYLAMLTVFLWNDFLCNGLHIHFRLCPYGLFGNCCGNVYFLDYREPGHCCGAYISCTVCRLYG